MLADLLLAVGLAEHDRETTAASNKANTSMIELLVGNAPSPEQLQEVLRTGFADLGRCLRSGDRETRNAAVRVVHLCTSELRQLQDEFSLSHGPAMRAPRGSRKPNAVDKAGQEDGDAPLDHARATSEEASLLWSVAMGASPKPTPAASTPLLPPALEDVDHAVAVHTSVALVLPQQAHPSSSAVPVPSRFTPLHESDKTGPILKDKLRKTASGAGVATGSSRSGSPAPPTVHKSSGMAPESGVEAVGAAGAGSKRPRYMMSDGASMLLQHSAPAHLAVMTMRHTAEFAKSRAIDVYSALIAR
jgi:hypothetical protein